jgi:hypothetical protein
LHLELEFEIKDLGEIFKLGDVHGALWINKRLVAVDQSLDPNRFPAKKGRYRFTLAHEAGHWQLHRPFFLENNAQLGLFEETDTKPAYVCRSSEKGKPIEWQANFFAAHLLMPTEIVRREWESWRGNYDPISVDELRATESAVLELEAIRRGGLPSDRKRLDNILTEVAVRPLAERFEVSAEAMRIQAERLGMIRGIGECSLFD